MLSHLEPLAIGTHIENPNSPLGCNSYSYGPGVDCDGATWNGATWTGGLAELDARYAYYLDAKTSGTLAYTGTDAAQPDARQSARGESARGGRKGEGGNSNG